MSKKQDRAKEAKAVVVEPTTEKKEENVTKETASQSKDEGNKRGLRRKWNQKKSQLEVSSEVVARLVNIAEEIDKKTTKNSEILKGHSEMLKEMSGRLGQVEKVQECFLSGDFSSTGLSSAYPKNDSTDSEVSADTKAEVEPGNMDLPENELDQLESASASSVEANLHVGDVFKVFDKRTKTYKIFLDLWHAKFISPDYNKVPAWFDEQGRFVRLMDPIETISTYSVGSVDE